MSGFPEEWPVEPCGGALRTLDGELRCQICGEIFEAPLSLECGHVFCSACIRRSIEFQERQGRATCPSCRSPTDATHLRQLPTLKNIAEGFRAARSYLLTAVSAAQASSVALARRRKGTTGEAVRRDRRPRAGQSSAAARNGTSAARTAGPSAGPSRAQRQPRQEDGGLGLSSSSDDFVQVPQKRVQTRGNINTPGAGGTATTASKRDCAAPGTCGKTRSGLKRRRSLRLHSGEADRDTADCAPSDEGEGGEGNGDAKRLHRDSSLPADTSVILLDSGSSEEGTAASEGEAGNSSDDDYSPASERQSPGAAPKVPLRDRQAAAGSQQQPQQQPQKHQSSRLPASHVSCPVCSKSMPHAFINAHLDSCMGQGSAPAVVLQGGKEHKSARKLEVPPKLASHLLSEKQLREKLKRYHLHTVGKKEALAERYTRFRLEVQTANDAGERVTYQALARRLVRQDDRTAAAQLTHPRVRATTPAAASSAGVANSFDELIRSTKDRQAAARKARPAADPVVVTYTETREVHGAKTGTDHAADAAGTESAQPSGTEPTQPIVTEPAEVSVLYPARGDVEHSMEELRRGAGRPHSPDQPQGLAGSGSDLATRMLPSGQSSPRSSEKPEDGGAMVDDAFEETGGEEWGGCQGEESGWNETADAAGPLTQHAVQDSDAAELSPSHSRDLGQLQTVA